MSVNYKLINTPIIQNKAAIDYFPSRGAKKVDTYDRFGLPVGIKAGGIGLDIPMTKVVVADNNDQQNYKNYRLQAGMIASSLEHQTPEQMYNTDPANPVQGISTMKAFAIASAEGQKLYTLTQENINEVLPKITASSLVKGAISSAVAAGQTVTVHERPVSVPGYTGTGYMVVDDRTGNTAFMIGGGGNGGWADIEERLMQPLYALYFMFTHLDETAAIFWPTIIGTIASTLDNILDISDTFFQCGGIVGLVSALMAAMIAIITAFPIMIVTLLPILVGIQYILIGLIMYGGAVAFNEINENIQGHCRQ